jgi:predicted enzyme related to lactoylglutathione lyase
MIENLSGIIVWTDNLERLRNFYEQALGLTPHSVRENFIAYKWNAGKAEIRFSIGLHSRVNGRSKDPFRAMINFNVTDINEVRSRLKAHGTKFIREPELEHWGGLVATFEDPDSNIIQMLQQPENHQIS